jgi:hypothetical protein
MEPTPDVRPLTAEERSLLEWLIEHGTRNASAYLPQLDTVSVVSRCHCGCPTIDLAVAGKAAPPGGSTVLADFDGVSPEGVQVGVILHALDGLLAELEVYDLTGGEEFSLPSTAGLT